MLDMYDQPKYRTFEACDFFADGSSARPVVPGTIARGQLHEDEVFYTGRRDGQFVDELPSGNDLELSDELLQRGHQRFDIFCSNCHGQAGYGDGMIVQRGFPPSALVSYRPLAKHAAGLFLRRHDQRLRCHADL